MKLHNYPDEFQELTVIVAREKHIPESAVRRDYYIVMMLQALEKSPYGEQCVFKGGTSLSKCYPGSIERFSEDIDLTFLGMELPDKECDRTIKKIESAMSVGAQTEKIGEERFQRSKSLWVWFDDPINRVKLEIGSTVRPDPYSKQQVKTYIQEFLESQNATEDIARFELVPVTVNVLNVERTFIDKVMSVKRHAICGTLPRKVRHIYDVTKLYQLPEIQTFLADKEELKWLVKQTKETDSFYVGRRNTPRDYDPTGPYGLASWIDRLDPDIQSRYESLHKDLLYTEEQQDFTTALETFRKIDMLLQEIGE